MLKVTIENKGSSSLSVKGRHGFYVGAHSTMTLLLPDTTGSQNTIQRLRREYPALRLRVEKGEPSPTDTGGDTANPSGEPSPDAPSAPTGPSGTADGGAAGAGVMSMEEFASRAIAAEGESGWWTVAVEGLSDIKVRAAKSEENAIEMAYGKYVKGQGGE